MSDSNYCAHCGAKVPENSSFCPQCGGPIEGVKLDKDPIGEPKDVSQEEKVDLPTLKAVDESDVTQPSYSDFEDTVKKQEIDVMDTCFIKEDLREFKKVMAKVKSLYLGSFGWNVLDYKIH